MTPALWASSAAAAAAEPSWGQMMRTLAPLVIRASTLALSLAESPWLNRIAVVKPAVLKASWNRVWSWIQRGSSLVGSTMPTWTLGPVLQATRKAAVGNTTAASAISINIRRFILGVLLTFSLCNFGATVPEICDNRNTFWSKYLDRACAAPADLGGVLLLPFLYSECDPAETQGDGRYPGPWQRP